MRPLAAALLVATAAACGTAPSQHPPCAADTSCATGSVCVDGACVPGCPADKDCRAGRLCIDGRCTDAVDAATADASPGGDAAAPLDAATDAPTSDATAPVDAAAPADLTVVDFAAVDLAAPIDLTVVDLVAVDLLTPPDLSTGPTDTACYSGWRSLNGTCPAPIITAAYYSNSGCVGTAGMFFEGDYFEYSGPDSNGGYDGPTTGGTINYPNVTRWNVLSATAMCVTICPNCGQTGSVYVTNPDGKRSNTVQMGFR